jgi:TonB family protein
MSRVHLWSQLLGFVLFVATAAAAGGEYTPQSGGPRRVGELGLRRAATVAPKPVFPIAAIQTGTEGVVVVGIQIDAAGEVESTHVLESPDVDMADAVLDAVRRWRFRGATKSRTGKLTFYFRIEGTTGRVLSPDDLRAPRTPDSGELPQTPVKIIGSEDLRALASSGRVSLVDPRERIAFRARSVPGRVNIPTDELGVRATIELPIDHPLVIDCTYESLSLCRIAADIVREEGFPSVLILRNPGGF